MFARKLSRLAGLVFVLVALIGGGSAFETGAQHGTGGNTIVADDTGIIAEDTGAATEPSSSQPGDFQPFELDWT